MSSVASILQQLAENAGRRPSGASLIGNVIQDVAQVPGQIMDARAQQVALAQQQARQRAADQRLLRTDQREEFTRREEIRKQTGAREIITAYTVGTPNEPGTNSLDIGIAKAIEIGMPEYIPTLRKMHEDAQPKITQLDRNKDTYANGVLQSRGEETPPNLGTPAREVYDRQKVYEAPVPMAPGDSGPATPGLPPLEASQRAYEDQRAAETKAKQAGEASPLSHREWQAYVKEGGKLGYNEYQTMDANRKRPLSITNAASDNQLIDTAARNILANPRDLTSIKNITTLRGDQRLQLFNRLKELNPDFNVGNIDRQIKFVDSYEDPKGRIAMNRQAMNNILLHSGDLSDVNQNYRRTNVRLANTPINTLKKQYSTEWTEYATTIAVLKDEIALYFAAGYAPSSDQGKTWDKILNDDATPNQVEAFAKQLIHVGMRRASTHNSDFKSVMGYDDPNLITPDAASAAQRLGLGELVKPFGSGGTLGDKPKTTTPARIRYDMNGNVVK